jgi:predicted metal-binding protein
VIGKTFSVTLINGKCAECGKTTFVAPNGLCLECTVKAIGGRPMRSTTGKAVSRRNREVAV